MTAVLTWVGPLEFDVMRCPPGSPGGGRFTDENESNCDLDDQQYRELREREGAGPKGQLRLPREYDSSQRHALWMLRNRPERLISERHAGGVSQYVLRNGWTVTVQRSEDDPRRHEMQISRPGDPVPAMPERPREREEPAAPPEPAGPRVWRAEDFEIDVYSPNGGGDANIVRDPEAPDVQYLLKGVEERADGNPHNYEQAANEISTDALREVMGLPGGFGEHRLVESQVARYGIATETLETRLGTENGPAGVTDWQDGDMQAVTTESLVQAVMLDYVTGGSDRDGNGVIAATGPHQPVYVPVDYEDSFGAARPAGPSELGSNSAGEVLEELAQRHPAEVASAAREMMAELSPDRLDAARDRALAEFPEGDREARAKVEANFEVAKDRLARLLVEPEAAVHAITNGAEGRVRSPYLPDAIDKRGAVDSIRRFRVAGASLIGDNPAALVARLRSDTPEAHRALVQHFPEGHTRFTLPSGATLDVLQTNRGLILVGTRAGAPAPQLNALRNAPARPYTGQANRPDGPLMNRPREGMPGGRREPQIPGVQPDRGVERPPQAGEQPPAVAEDRPKSIVRPEVLEEAARTLPEATFRAGEPKFVELAKATYEGAHPGGLRTVVTSAHEGHVSGLIQDSNGARVGTFTRIFSVQGKAVTHEYMSLDANVQGQGFAESFNGRAEAFYATHGVERISVHANIDVGGYTWAQQGFDFSYEHGAGQFHRSLQRIADGVWPDSVANVRRQVWGDDPPEVPQALRDEARALLAKGRFSAYELSRLGAKTDAYERKAQRIYSNAPSPGARTIKTWLGKDLMLDSDWYGRKAVPRYRGAVRAAGELEKQANELPYEAAEWPEEREAARARWVAEGLERETFEPAYINRRPSDYNLHWLYVELDPFPDPTLD